MLLFYVIFDHSLIDTSSVLPCPFLKLFIAAILIGLIQATFALFVSGMAWKRFYLMFFFLIFTFVPLLFELFNDLHFLELLLNHVFFFILIQKVLVHIFVQKF
jgi:hypothetical protein